MRLSAERPWKISLFALLLWAGVEHAGVPLAFAQVSDRKSSSTPVAVKADARLLGSETRTGLKLVFVGEGALVSSCSGLCKQSENELRYEVPSEARALPRTTQIIKLRDREQALW